MEDMKILQFAFKTRQIIANNCTFSRISHSFQKNGNGNVQVLSYFPFGNSGSWLIPAIHSETVQIFAFAFANPERKQLVKLLQIITQFLEFHVRNTLHTVVLDYFNIKE